MNHASTTDSGGTGSAVFAGIAAALAAGAAWATIVAVTGYEVGYVAWGVGLLVGFAMAKLTAVRGKSIAVTAAVLSALGLIVGKALIIGFAAKPAIAKEIANDNETLAQAAIHHMRETRTFPAPIQNELAALGENDSVPDALWARMETAAHDRANRATPAERDAMATAYAGAVMMALGPVGMLSAQMSVFDLLWFFLAISTAWRMLRGPKEEAAAGAAAT